MILGCVRLIWGAEKSNVDQTVIKIRQIRQSMQAVPLKKIDFKECKTNLSAGKENVKQTEEKIG